MPRKPIPGWANEESATAYFEATFWEKLGPMIRVAFFQTIVELSGEPVATKPTRKNAEPACRTWDLDRLEAALKKAIESGIVIPHAKVGTRTGYMVMREIGADIPPDPSVFWHCVSLLIQSGRVSISHYKTAGRRVREKLVMAEAA